MFRRHNGIESGYCDVLSATSLNENKSSPTEIFQLYDRFNRTCKVKIQEVIMILIRVLDDPKAS